MQNIVPAIQRIARHLGIYLVRYPPPGSHDRALRDALQALAITHVVDVGAHTGEFGRKMRHLGFDGELLSFEPVPESFATLSKYAQQDGRWRVFPHAVGRTSAAARLNVASNDVFSSLLEADPIAPGMTNQMITPIRQINVKVRTLESLWSAPLNLEGARVLLKTDTQGYDMEVITGAGEGLNDVLAIQLELPFRTSLSGDGDFGEAIRLLSELGYVMHSLAPAATTSTGEILEVDCLLVGEPAYSSDRSGAQPQSLSWRPRMISETRAMLRPHFAVRCA